MAFKIIIISLFLLFISSREVFAASPYVLPYPSFMPAHPFYKISHIKDELLRFWYFGDFGQFKYNLKQSDKYLVEAKTLFEYKQYRLAINALENSNLYIKKALPNLLKAERKGKNINEKLFVLKLAKEKHIEILKKIKNEVPETFYWNPEKEEAVNLTLHKILDKSIQERAR